MIDSKYPIEGSCQCGQISYQLLEPPLMVAACHCKECQKLSTSAFSITAVVKTESVVFGGELKEWRRVADSGNKNYAKFCPSCGNRMYHFDPDNPETIKLKPSNLADTSWLEPSVHVWVSQKQAWYQVPEGVRQFDKQPPA
ncbi:MAG: GFA family protein [Porticoccaceae bacterium]|nr:GFA family protein [Porticoccaceae bacterium]